MATAGVSATVAAEIHNMHLQLAFVQAGYGLGLRFLNASCATHSGEATLSGDQNQLGLNLEIDHCNGARSGPLGSLEAAANLLQWMPYLSCPASLPGRRSFATGGEGATKDGPHLHGRPGSGNRPPQRG